MADDVAGHICQALPRPALYMVARLWGLTWLASGDVAGMWRMTSAGSW